MAARADTPSPCVQPQNCPLHSPQKPSTNSLKSFVVSVKAVRISVNTVKAGGTLVSLKRHNGGALQEGATASPSSAFFLGKSVE